MQKVGELVIACMTTVRNLGVLCVTDLNVYNVYVSSLAKIKDGKVVAVVVIMSKVR